MEVFLAQVRVAHHGVEEREGMAVGRGDAKLALKLKPACGKAWPRGHHSETIIKLFCSTGSERFKITTVEQRNKK